MSVAWQIIEEEARRRKPQDYRFLRMLSLRATEANIPPAAFVREYQAVVKRLQNETTQSNTNINMGLRLFNSVAEAYGLGPLSTLPNLHTSRAHANSAIHQNLKSQVERLNIAKKASKATQGNRQRLLYACARECLSFGDPLNSYLDLADGTRLKSYIKRRQPQVQEGLKPIANLNKLIGYLAQIARLEGNIDAEDVFRNCLRHMPKMDLAACTKTHEGVLEIDDPAFDNDMMRACVAAITIFQRNPSRSTMRLAQGGLACLLITQETIKVAELAGANWDPPEQSSGNVRLMIPAVGARPVVDVASSDETGAVQVIVGMYVDGIRKLLGPLPQSVFCTQTGKPKKSCTISNDVAYFMSTQLGVKSTPTILRDRAIMVRHRRGDTFETLKTAVGSRHTANIRLRFSNLAGRQSHRDIAEKKCG